MKSTYLHKSTISILAFIVCSWQSQAQEKVQKIDSLMSIYHQYEQLNGSVLVAENGKVIYKKSFGYADMGWKILNTSDTKFRIASMTKQFTAMLIMQLIQEGRLKVTDNIIDHIPEYPKESGGKVSIHNLLTHTSGIPSYTNFPNYFMKYTEKSYSPLEFIKEFWELELDFEPGSNYKYSNSGYFLLGVIIEKVTGKTYKTILQEKILDPLKMANTGLDENKIILEKHAKGYVKTYDGFENGPYWNVSQTGYSAGGMYTTVEDMYLWDEALYKNELISKEGYRIMTTPFLNNYAYGWQLYRKPLGDSGDSVNCIEHAGFLPDHNSIITRIPDTRLLIVILNNYRLNEIFKIKNSIINILYDIPLDDSNSPKLSIAARIYQTKNDKGIEAAIEQYHSLKNDSTDYYTFSSRELNLLGYHLLRKGELNSSIEIFKLCVETYPESFNAYDSLAEAYMENGNDKLAIKNYNKSLELNPGNKNATKMLKELKKE